MLMKKVYISGQISGLPREIYLDNFIQAERLLRDQGYKVVNPVRFAPCRWLWLYRLLGYRLTLLYDLWRMLRCDFIYKIPGWKSSRGAQIESCVAFHFDIWLLPPKERSKTDLKLARHIDKRIPSGGAV